MDTRTKAQVAEDTRKAAAIKGIDLSDIDLEQMTKEQLLKLEAKMKGPKISTPPPPKRSRRAAPTEPGSHTEVDAPTSAHVEINVEHPRRSWLRKKPGKSS